MKCAICKTGQTAPGKATVTLERGRSVIVIRSVPAEICNNCGEYYLDEQTSETVVRIAEDAAKRGVEVEVLQYGGDAA
jgi:YgiT-type zinc finger domain-containing protein